MHRRRAGNRDDSRTSLKAIIRVVSWSDFSQHNSVLSASLRLAFEQGTNRRDAEYAETTQTLRLRTIVIRPHGYDFLIFQYYPNSRLSRAALAVVSAGIS